MSEAEDTLGLFAAMVLAAVGLFGMLAQFVAQKRRKIGLRMALGGRPTQVFAEVFRYSAATTSIGVAAGLATALALARFMAAIVCGIESPDQATFAIAPLLLVAAGGGPRSFRRDERSESIRSPRCATNRAPPYH